MSPHTQTTDPDPLTGAKSPIALTLQVEGAAFGVAAVLAYHLSGSSWWLFALLILAPDLAMLGYMAGKRVGAICYNVAHSYVLPLILLMVGAVTQAPMVTAMALIWVAHIGLDRAIGYGLKYATAFKDTHLHRV